MERRKKGGWVGVIIWWSEQVTQKEAEEGNENAERTDQKDWIMIKSDSDNRIKLLKLDTNSAYSKAPNCTEVFCLSSQPSAVYQNVLNLTNARLIQPQPTINWPYWTNDRSDELNDP